MNRAYFVFFGVSGLPLWCNLQSPKVDLLLGSALQGPQDHLKPQDRSQEV